jgi:hypothetical protein
VGLDFDGLASRRLLALDPREQLRRALGRVGGNRDAITVVDDRPWISRHAIPCDYTVPFLVNEGSVEERVTYCRTLVPRVHGSPFCALRAHEQVVKPWLVDLAPCARVAAVTCGEYGDGGLERPRNRMLGALIAG